MTFLIIFCDEKSYKYFITVFFVCNSFLSKLFAEALIHWIVLCRKYPHKKLSHYVLLIEKKVLFTERNNLFQKAILENFNCRSTFFRQRKLNIPFHSLKSYFFWILKSIKQKCLKKTFNVSFISFIIYLFHWNLSIWIVCEQ